MGDEGKGYAPKGSTTQPFGLPGGVPGGCTLQFSMGSKKGFFFRLIMTNIPPLTKMIKSFGVDTSKPPLNQGFFRETLDAITPSSLNLTVYTSPLFLDLGLRWTQPRNCLCKDLQCLKPDGSYACSNIGFQVQAGTPPLIPCDKAAPQP